MDFKSVTRTSAIHGRAARAAAYVCFSVACGILIGSLLGFGSLSTAMTPAPMSFAIAR